MSAPYATASVLLADCLLLISEEKIAYSNLEEILNKYGMTNNMQSQSLPTFRNEVKTRLLRLLARESKSDLIKSKLILSLLCELQEGTSV